MKALANSIYTWLILLGLVCLILLSFAAWDRTENERDKRTEDGEHFFLTFTPSTISQIYRDDWRIRPRKISGKLDLPPGDGPFPAVIIYHGHYHVEDMDPWFQQLVPRLIDKGIATFVLDSFTGRKITNTAFNGARLSRAARLTDIFQAMNWLARLDEIDEERIGITGYSVGGTTAMLAADRRVNETSVAGGRSFASLLPVYPACQVRFRREELTGAPMLILLAAKDDYSPTEFCGDYVARATEAGNGVLMKKYAGAQHGWVNKKASTDCEDCMTFRNCGQMYIEENGHESALEGRVSTLFGWRDYMENVYRECGTIGVLYRSDKEISTDTLNTTTAFFAENLKHHEKRW